jgi:hypothetical protein
MKLTKRTTFEVEYYDFEEFIAMHYGRPYSFVIDMDIEKPWMGYENHFDVNGKLIPIQYQEIFDFATFGSYYQLAPALLNDFCERKIIESGHYIILAPYWKKEL